MTDLATILRTVTITEVADRGNTRKGYTASYMVRVAGRLVGRARQGEFLEVCFFFDGTPTGYSPVVSLRDLREEAAWRAMGAPC